MELCSIIMEKYITFFMNMFLINTRNLKSYICSSLFDSLFSAYELSLLKLKFFGKRKILHIIIFKKQIIIYE